MTEGARRTAGESYFGPEWWKTPGPSEEECAEIRRLARSAPDITQDDLIRELGDAYDEELANLLGRSRNTE